MSVTDNDKQTVGEDTESGHGKKDWKVFSDDTVVVAVHVVVIVVAVVVVHVVVIDIMIIVAAVAFLVVAEVIVCR